MSPHDAAAIAAELQGLSRRFDEHAQRTQRDLASLLAEAKKTNGRVTSLEKTNVREEALAKGLKEGRMRVTGFTYHPLFAAIVASIVSVALYALFQH